MKILYFIYGLNNGGAETFIYNVLANINLNKYNIELLIQQADIINKKIGKLIEKNRIKVHQITPINKNPYKFYVQYKKVLETEKFDVVHIHLNSLINRYSYLLPYSLGNKVIIHAHNSNSNAGRVGRIAHKINKLDKRILKMKHIACSNKAGKWMFGNLPYTFIPNGIDFNVFKFDETVQKKLRKQYHIPENSMIIGHIGRYVEAKNHELIIEIYKSLRQTNVNVFLILIGDGPLFKTIENKIKEYSLDDFIIQIQCVENPQDYYSLFDLLLFPSKFEGLPFVMVEAQATGLPIVCSDIITEEVIYTPLVKRMPIDTTVSGWVNIVSKQIGSILNHKNRRTENVKTEKSIQYDIKKTINELENMYEECIQ